MNVFPFEARVKTSLRDFLVAGLLLKKTLEAQMPQPVGRR